MSKPRANTTTAPGTTPHAPTHYNAQTLADITGLTHKQTLEIIHHYDLAKDADGNIHLRNFLRFAIKHTRETITLPELVDLFQITSRQINNLTKLGTLPKLSRGIYPRAQTITAYITHLRRSAEGKGDTTLNAAQLRETIARADERELKVADLQEQIVNVEEAVHALQSAITVTRQRILNIAKEAIAHLDTIPTAALREDALTHKLHEALTELVAVPKKIKQLAARKTREADHDEEEEQQPTKKETPGSTPRRQPKPKSQRSSNANAPPHA